MSDYDAALSAFQAALPADDAAGNQPPAGSPSDAPATPQEPAQEPASRDIDVSGLPEEAQLYLRARERELQGDYTRKTQEIAEQRREAEQAMQFLQALNSDPDFAYNVLNQLQGNLAAAGYSFDQGADEYGIDEDSGYDPYQAEIARLSQQQEAIQEAMLEQQLSANLDYQLSQIASQHPEWGDSEYQAIIDLGYATNGDLFSAAKQFEAINDSVILRYLQSKGSVNAPAPLPNTGSAATPLPTPKTDEELRAAAMERIRAELG